MTTQDIYSAAESIAVAAARRAPQDGRLGLFCREAEERQSLGNFFWFDDIASLQRFVGEVLIAFHKPDALLRQTACRMTYKTWLKSYVFSASRIDSEKIVELVPDLNIATESERQLQRQALNVYFQGLVEIEWWGRFADITDGTDDFACGIRRRFLEGGRKYWLGTGISSLSPSDLPSFKHFLYHYEG